MFEFDPTSEEDDLFPEGEYDAVVKKAEAKVSKKKPDGSGGNSMLELIVTVYGPDRRKADVFDYLVNTENGRWKIRSFCASAGIEYDGRMDEKRLPGTNVRVMLFKEKPQNGYPAKNKIGEYVARGDGSPVGATTGVAAEDPDCPF